MSFAEFAASVAGYNRAQGGGSRIKHAKDWTDSDMDEAERLLDEAMARNAARGVSLGD